MSPNLIVFTAAAVVSIVAALCVILMQNSVRCALALVANFFVLAFLYFTLNAEMLGITQIVVYAGAIMVLFLFVIMLLNVGSPAKLVEKTDYKRMIAGLLALSIMVVAGSQVLGPMLEIKFTNAPDSYGGPHALGRAMFSAYAYPFESVSVLLLIGIVGSILLAKRKLR